MTGEWQKVAHKNAGWLVGIGILEIVLGVLVMGMPLAGGIGMVSFIGVLMIVAGIARLVGAFSAGSFGAGALSFVWGILVATAGFFMLSNPGVGLATLTLMLSMMFFVSGISECVAAFQARPVRGWGWMLFGGAASVLLAIMVWRQFPFSGIWLVGTLVGVKLLLNGITLVTFGGAARKMTAA